MYCKKCGYKLDDSATFCSNCGTPTREFKPEMNASSESDTTPRNIPIPETQPTSALIVLGISIVCFFLAFNENLILRSTAILIGFILSFIALSLFKKHKNVYGLTGIGYIGYIICRILWVIAIIALAIISVIMVISAFMGASL